MHPIPLRLAACLATLVLATGVSLAQAPAPAAAPGAAAPAGPAPTQSHLDAARALIQLTGVLSTVDEMLPAFGEQIRQRNITRPELAKDLGEVLKSLEPELQLQKLQITNVVTQSYAKFFTEDELKQLVVFFKSPLGSRFLTKQPDLLDEVADEVTGWSQQASEYVMVRTRAEMAKRGQQMQ